MAEPVTGHERWLVARHVLERLTVVKVRIGVLRLRLRRGTLAPAEVEAHLDQIEREIDATASVATNVHAEGSGTA
jgi:hypothetical protein